MRVSRYPRWRGAQALVLGAAGGVGMRVCALLDACGASLTLVVHHQEQVVGVQAEYPTATVLSLDLADCLALNDLIARLPEVDILIDCVGRGNISDFFQRPWIEIEGDIAANMLGSMRLFHHYAQGMLARRHGWILFFGSTAASRPAPELLPYGPAKKAMEALVRSVHLDLARQGVQVVCLICGPVRTAFSEKAGIPRSDGDDPGEIADLALRALYRHSGVLPVDMKTRWRRYLFLLLPDRWTRWLLDRK